MRASVRERTAKETPDEVTPFRSIEKPRLSEYQAASRSTLPVEREKNEPETAGALPVDVDGAEVVQADSGTTRKAHRSSRVRMGMIVCWDAVKEAV
jgi:hypothetical protein